MTTRRGEFARIEAFLRPLAAATPGALGLADDAAWLAVSPGRRLVVTADAMVEGVHYLAGEPPGRLARKLLRVNLSDLAAMGAVPKGYLLTLALPAAWSDEVFSAFAEGLAQDQARYAVSLLGGDCVSTPGPTVLSITAFGEVDGEAMLTRAGAAIGDRVLVSGTLGDGALGLVAARDGIAGLDPADAEALAGRYHLPEPRLALGGALVGVAGACADVSDGLVGDLGHICRASGVAARIEAARLPLSAAGRAAIAAQPDLRVAALSGGDDYELVFTVPPDRLDAVRRIAVRLDLPVSEIGTVVAASAGAPPVLLVGEDGAPIPEIRGWEHG